ncbi:MAG: NUDIX domain-containing protein [Catenulispora sp.]
MALPGGGVEHGESPEAAVRREFLEETRLIVRVDRLLDGRYEQVTGGLRPGDTAGRLSRMQAREDVRTAGRLAC